MPTAFRAVLAGWLTMVVVGTAAAQYDINWWTVDGGGAMFTMGGAYELSGTIGQPDAGAAMTGGSYELVGGFWAIGAAAPPVTCVGDANGDGLVNFADISPFIAAIKAGNAGAWTCNLAGGFGPYLNSDTNGDGVVNFSDISPFIALIKAPPPPCVSTCP
ncbi:MAG: hypothetical protein IPM18_13540 [Phycisphaerales bacterium]|nr:hypothetical protein [Phycisphaerales bacterium]